MIVLSGQVKRADMVNGQGIRQQGMQEVDIISMVKPGDEICSACNRTTGYQVSSGFVRCTKPYMEERDRSGWIFR